MTDAADAARPASHSQRVNSEGMSQRGSTEGISVPGFNNVKLAKPINTRMGETARNLSGAISSTFESRSRPHRLKLCHGGNRAGVVMDVEVTIAAIVTVIIIIVPNLGLFFATNFSFLNLPRYFKNQNLFLSANFSFFAHFFYEIRQLYFGLFVLFDL